MINKKVFEIKREIKVGNNVVSLCLRRNYVDKIDETRSKNVPCIIVSDDARGQILSILYIFENIYRELMKKTEVDLKNSILEYI